MILEHFKEKTTSISCYKSIFSLCFYHINTDLKKYRNSDTSLNCKSLFKANVVVVCDRDVNFPEK